MNKRYRLRKNSDFQRVYRRCSSQSAKTMAVLALKVRRQEVRIGFSVSKKIGKSVQRNHIKRRLREIVRLMLPEIKTGYHIVVIARSAAASSDYAHLRDEMRQLFTRCSLLKDG